MLSRCLANGGSQSTCEARAIRGANSAVGEPELSTEQRRLVVQAALTVPPHRLSMQEQEFLLAPCVLLVSGVVNGGLVLEESITPQDWCGVPVVIGHPTDSAGQAISAGSPGVLARCGVGQVVQARAGVGQRAGHAVRSLQGGLLIDIGQVQTLGGEAAQALTKLEQQQPLEVSTAFWPDVEARQGTAYGTPYHEVYTALRPDHLALLPNGIGACSWEAGCGSPRLNQQCTCGDAGSCHCQGGMPMTHAAPKGWRGFVQVLKDFVSHAETELVTEQTDGDVREALYGALAREQSADSTYIYIDSLDMENKTFTYRVGERLKQRSWTLEDGVIALAADERDVQRETRYIPVEGPTTEEEHSTMAQPTAAVHARATALITNTATIWEESDRVALEAMSDTQLARLEAAAQPAAAAVAVTPAPQTEAEALALLPGPMRDSLTRLMAREKAQKDAAIAALIANQYPVPQEVLATLELEHLQQLVAREERQEMRANANYEGLGMPNRRSVDGNEDQRTVPEPLNTLAQVVELQKQRGILT
jgi:hypothetical protein